MESCLKSLTPTEELAVFLSIRGMCQRAAVQVSTAADSFAAAARLAPGCASYRKMADRLAAEASAPKLTKTQQHQSPL